MYNFTINLYLYEVCCVSFLFISSWLMHVVPSERVKSLMFMDSDDVLNDNDS
jgi:hypothetical protein